MNVTHALHAIEQARWGLESSPAGCWCAISPGSLAMVWVCVCFLSLAALAVLVRGALCPAPPQEPEPL